MTDRSFDRAVADWLEDGSDRTSAAAIDAVLLAVKTTPQERDLRIPRRFTLMPTYMRLAAAFAIVAIAGVATLSFLNRGSSPGVVPSPSAISSPSSIPSPAPSASPSSPGIDTAMWTKYTSERYGFDIKRPPDWADTQQSGHVWTLAEAADVQSTATEDFYYPGLSDGQGVRVSAWSVGVASGTSLDAWLQAYCSAATGASCPAGRQTVPVTMDGHAGLTIAGPGQDSEAFALVNDRVYVVKAWRSDDDPSVATFGGGRRLIEAFVSTIRLRPGGPAPTASPPALTGTFTSDVYGFSLKVPSGWTAARAKTPWNPAGNWSDDELDWVNAPSASGAFRVVSAVVPDSRVIEDWIVQNMTMSSDPGCAPARATLAPISIDGRTGALQTACDQVEASVVVGRRVYLFTLWAGEGTSYTSSARALFEALMATVQLTPDTADVVPSAKPS